MQIKQRVLYPYWAQGPELIQANYTNYTNGQGIEGKVVGCEVWVLDFLYL